MTIVIPQPIEAAQPRLTPLAILPPRPSYKFIKVEDYFRDYQSWYRLDKVKAQNNDFHKKGGITLALEFERHDGKSCTMLLQFPRKDSMRIRFNPNNAIADNYTSYNTRTVVLDTLDQFIDLMEDVKVVPTFPDKNTIQLTTIGEDYKPVMRVEVNYDPFRITVYDAKQDIQVWKTARHGVYYAPNEDGDYSIIQAIDKPATAKFIGFGEQGGKELAKNTSQLDYFNFDNMRYRQVYDLGPFEDSEPLYHSDPFFMAFNSVPDKDSVIGIFVDNPSHVCMDIGSLNSGRYLLGSRFGDLNYYVFLGQTCANVLEAYTSFVGKARLKPRYVLGYHQGCYGYETRADLERVVRDYRAHQIPLDGLHVDVDVQYRYQTFTIDESKFPNLKEMFAALKAQGVKCSTNITPIISNLDPNYQTYREGLENGYFVTDERVSPEDPAGWRYQDYGGGNEYYQTFTDPEHNFNSGKPFIGEVYYGGDRGTTGHYADFGRKEVRIWWGKQYQYLFDMGLEMVWQDMTTPAIRNTRGDMRGFPFRLLVTDDFFSGTTPKKSPAIRAWNLYSYNLHKATYHGLNELEGRKNKRNFIIGRGSFTGIHRFAGLWTGDNASSWEFLRINVSQVLALGLCGTAIAGEDIGGFERERDWEHWADPELLIRWTCAGAFLSWFRNHYIAKGLKYFQEPYAYQYALDKYDIPQEVRYLYHGVLPICKHYIELRYRLLQLFYDALFEHTLNGMPICRAMILTDPKDKALFNDKLEFLDNQFLVREDLLIAPILEPQLTCHGGKRDVYLPAHSDWYLFMDNKRPLLPIVEGGTTVRNFDAYIDASNEHMGFIVPMYVRAGAIIPTIELEQYVGERNANNQPNPITLNIYPASLKEAKGEYTMYLDDGVSRSSAPKHLPGSDDQANDEYRQTRISHEYIGSKTREIRVERIHDNYTPSLEHYFFVAVLHDPSEARGSAGPLRSISIAGHEIHPIVDGTSEQRADVLNNASDNAWYYNENVNISFIKVFDNSSSIIIRAEYV